MPKTKILIVGLGLIGGSYAKRLKDLDYLVYGYDINQDTIQTAYFENVIQNNQISDLSFFSEMDLVVLSLYPSDNVEFLRKYQSLFKEKTIITDTTGIKGQMIKEMLSFIRPDLVLIPTHPMAGKEVSGYQNSTPNLFLEANFIITPLNRENDDHKEIQIIKKLGNDLGFLHIEVLSVSEHDEIISFLSLCWFFFPF